LSILVIETAASACSVALIDHGSVLASVHEEVGRGHAERLIPMIASLPERGRANRILVDCGPGSFTGVRVGIAAARGLGLAWGIAVQGYSSLGLIAATADWEDADTLAVAIAGGHGQLFVQRFSRDPMAPITATASLVPEKAAAALTDRIVAGNAAESLVALRGFGTAQPGALAAAAVARMPASLLDLPAKPIYGRAPDAKPIAS
jgi:tRNA threonylcarbamoyladenosine biosynthesis protein TsaB